MNPHPLDRGAGALAFLTESGLKPRAVSIRSSDFNTVFTCPFLFFLTRRIGLVQAHRWSKALSRGSWFHAHMEHWKSPTTTRHTALRKKLEARCAELAATLGGSEAAKGFQEREMRDEGSARAWVDCLLEMRLPGGATLEQRFGSCSVLAIEPTLNLQINEQGPRDANVWATIQPDLLLLDPNNRIIIVDWKSTSGPARNRLATCPLEDQTRHYIWVLNQLVERNALSRQLDTTLPSDIRVGSMVHVAFQKCPLEFCDSDAPREWISEGKRSGITARGVPHRDQWQGLTEGSEPQTFLQEQDLLTWMHSLTGKKPESRIIGAPDYNRYLTRVKHWYRADGPYTHLATDRNPSDILDLSVTDASILLGSDHIKEYLHDLYQVAHFASVEAEPHNFPRRANHLTHRASLSPYLGFYTNPIRDWPSIALRESMIISHRDLQLPEELA